MDTKSIPEIAAEIFGLLEPLESGDRQRVVAGAMAMLGEGTRASRSSSPTDGALSNSETTIKPGGKATAWINKYDLSEDQLEQVFHFEEDGSVEVLDGHIPGTTKKAMTINAYMLLGISKLLSSDSSKFDDSAAVDLCKRLGCHDRANHSRTRSLLGNLFTGSKNGGFALTAPGLSQAAEVIKEMS